MARRNTFPPSATERHMPPVNDSFEVVMAYVRALDSRDYEAAMNHLHDEVRIRGPAGETFGKPHDLIEMLRKYQGRYDIKKAFADGDDVCLLYDLKTNGPTVFMSSWYQVKEGKIASVHTVFDPRAFGPPQGKGPNPSKTK
jgi:limonene-1,2-epoxide hydrolase